MIKEDFSILQEKKGRGGIIDENVVLLLLR